MFLSGHLEKAIELSALVVALVSAAYLATLSFRACLRRLNPSLPRPASVVRALPALSLMAALASPASAGHRTRVLSPGGSGSPEPPWSGSRGFSPPPLLDRTGHFRTSATAFILGSTGGEGAGQRAAASLNERAPPYLKSIGRTLPGT